MTNRSTRDEGGVAVVAGDVDVVGGAGAAEADRVCDSDEDEGWGGVSLPSFSLMVVNAWIFVVAVKGPGVRVAE